VPHLSAAGRLLLDRIDDPFTGVDGKADGADGDSLDNT
jgi:hypothetical protein